METFLAQLFGIYFIIFGAVSLFRQKSLMPAVKEMLKNRGILLALAVVELAAGLAVILAYSKVSLDLAGLISLVGWVMTIEALLYLALPVKIVQKYMKRFNHVWWYRSGGILSIAAGAYLALAGFGIL